MVLLFSKHQPTSGASGLILLSKIIYESAVIPVRTNIIRTHKFLQCGSLGVVDFCLFRDEKSKNSINRNRNIEPKKDIRHRQVQGGYLNEKQYQQIKEITSTTLIPVFLCNGLSISINIFNRCFVGIGEKSVPAVIYNFSRAEIDYACTIRP